MGDAWPDVSIRGFCDAAPNTSDAMLALPDNIQVVRSQPSGEPYRGRVSLLEGPLSKKLEAYFKQSEQIQASIHL